jgi:hypothetical protein
MANKVVKEQVAEDKVLITFHVDKALLAEIEEYRWSNRCEGKAEAVRQLVVKGLRRRKRPSPARAPGRRPVRKARLFRRR